MLAEFNWLDFVLMLIVLMGLGRGFQTGFVHALISSIGWLVALIVATKGAVSVHHWFIGWVSSEVLQIALGFLALVIIVLAALYLLLKLAQHILNALNITVVDRMAGALLGAAKSVFVVLITISVLTPIAQRFEVWQQSVLIPELLPLSPLAVEFSKAVANSSYDLVQQVDQH